MTDKDDYDNSYDSVYNGDSDDDDYREVSPLALALKRREIEYTDEKGLFAGKQEALNYFASDPMNSDFVKAYQQALKEAAAERINAENILHNLKHLKIYPEETVVYPKVEVEKSSKVQKVTLPEEVLLFKSSFKDAIFDCSFCQWREGALRDIKAYLLEKSEQLDFPKIEEEIFSLEVKQSVLDGKIEIFGLYGLNIDNMEKDDFKKDHQDVTATHKDIDTDIKNIVKLFGSNKALFDAAMDSDSTNGLSLYQVLPGLKEKVLSRAFMEGQLKAITEAEKMYDDFCAKQIKQKLFDSQKIAEY